MTVHEAAEQYLASSGCRRPLARTPWPPTGGTCARSPRSPATSIIDAVTPALLQRFMASSCVQVDAQRGAAGSRRPSTATGSP